MRHFETKWPRRGLNLQRRGLSNRNPLQGNKSDASEPTPRSAFAQLRSYAMPICLGEHPPTVTSSSIIGGQLHSAADRLQRFCCKAVRQPSRLPHRWGRVMGRYRIGTNQDAPIIAVSGRQEWTLDRLTRAGAEGCTTVTDPAPRWSSYVHRLRAKGVEIETVREPHDGIYPGRHGRYFLRCAISSVPYEDSAVASSSPVRRAA